MSCGGNMEEVRIERTKIMRRQSKLVQTNRSTAELTLWTVARFYKYLLRGRRFVLNFACFTLVSYF